MCQNATIAALANFATVVWQLWGSADLPRHSVSHPKPVPKADIAQIEMIPPLQQFSAVSRYSAHESRLSKNPC